MYLVEESFGQNNKKRITDVIQSVFEDSETITTDDRSPYEEISEVNIQVLDKISGKVFKQKLAVGCSATFGTIKITIQNAYKNPPDEEREVVARISIEEKDQTIYSNWKFASSSSINLFEHRVYDVRVEF